MFGIKRGYMKLAVICLSLVVAGSLFTTAGNMASAAEKSPGSKNQPIAEKPPIKIKSHGLEYEIASFMVSANKADGHTIITMGGANLNKLNFRAGDALKRYIPILCSFIAPDGAEHEFVEAEVVNENSIIFKFGTSEKPKTVLFYADDDKAKRYTFALGQK